MNHEPQILDLDKVPYYKSWELSRQVLYLNLVFEVRDSFRIIYLSDAKIVEFNIYHTEKCINSYNKNILIDKNYYICPKSYKTINNET